MSKAVAVLVGAALLLGSVSAALGDGFVGESVSDDAKLRAGGSMAHHTVCELARGTRMVVVKQIGDWYLVQVPKEVPVWISEKWVRAESGDSGVVSGDRVNMRATPDTKYGALGTAERGTQVKILDRADGWLKIVPPDSALGWVYKSHLKRVAGVEPDDVRRSGYEAAGRKAEEKRAKSADMTRVAALLDETVEAILVEDLERAEKMLAAALAELDGAPPSALGAKAALWSEGIKKKREEDAAKVAAEQRRVLKQQEIDKAFCKKMRDLYIEEVDRVTPKKTRYEAVGILKGAGMMVLRRGTHTIVDADGHELYTLRAAPNSGVDLYDWKIFEKKVGIVGVVKDAPGWPLKVIEVTRVDLLEAGQE